MTMTGRWPATGPTTRRAARLGNRPATRPRRSWKPRPPRPSWPQSATSTSTRSNGLQADFDNFRKRSMRQQTDLLEHATEGLCVRLLPVLDALDLAIAHVRSQAEPSDSDKALEQIDSLIRDILAREGIERIDSVGVAFDPTIHDAVGQLPAEPPAAAAVEPPPHTRRSDTEPSRPRPPKRQAGRP